MYDWVLSGFRLLVRLDLQALLGLDLVLNKLVEMISCTSESKPLALPWERTPRLDSGVRVRKMLSEWPEWDPCRARVRGHRDCRRGLPSADVPYIDTCVDSAREIPVLLRTTNEASALLKWKASLNEQSQSRLSSWVGSNPCKNWMGIGCSNATANAQSVVTIIQIRNMSLIGTLLHLDTWSLQNLVTLSLPFNTLFGNIPSNLVNMSQLQTLDLSHNNFSGVIPPEIGMLKYMGHFHLNDNSLEGHIPDSIGNFTNLTLLYLHDNSLEGHIPDSIGPFLQKLCH
ncbi:kinase-like domain-containing protein [Tanacetum coccineum]